MAPTRKCSECAKPLLDKNGGPPLAGQMTCGRSCRDKRPRRLKREKAERDAQLVRNRELPEHLKPISDAVRGDVRDVTHQVLKEAIRPIVQEALTPDVLAGLGELVNLMPDAIVALGEDIRGNDPELRQRAYTLLLKYTAGNATIAPASKEAAPSPMTVVFEMPRPGDAAKPLPAVAPEDAVEVRDCVECEATKPAPEFVDGSNRCLSCQGVLEDMIAQRFAP